ncbi:MAG TPA: hypothetical protein VFG69_09270 [Nannocystaceae bacterium]|nr:hypothetical protein [Nannocystaceae bacterium]
MPRFSFVVMSSVLTVPSSAFADVLEVGPGKPYAAPCAAIAVAQAGDTIEIDAAGAYDGDVCGWPGVDGLVIRGVNGRPHIAAAGADAEGKAVWVVRGNDVLIENVEISGAAVADQNGAAIRHEGGNLTLRGVYFHDNEDGILTGDGDYELLIESSEFADNGLGDVGYTHNMYIGHITRFTLQYSYSHGIVEGHAVKTRAAENHILYNRIMDESDGASSYDIDFSNGGVAYVIGNLIQQGPNPANSGIIQYGAEGLQYETNGVYVVNNTIVNELGSGSFLNTNGDPPGVVRNNLFVGAGSINPGANATADTNFFAPMDGDPMLVDMAGYDYRIAEGSPCVDAGIDAGMAADGTPLAAAFHYVHPLMYETRTAVGVVDIGAYELDGGGGADSGDDAGTTAGDGTGDDAGSADGADESGNGEAGPDDGGSVSQGSAGTDGNDDALDDGSAGSSGSDPDETDDASSGCGCTASSPRAAPLGLLVLAFARRRRRAKSRHPARSPSAAGHRGPTRAGAPAICESGAVVVTIPLLRYKRSRCRTSDASSSFG